MTNSSRTLPPRRRTVRRAPALAAPTHAAPAPTPPGAADPTPAPGGAARRPVAGRAVAPLLALLVVPLSIAALAGPAAAAPFGAETVGGDGWNTLSVDKKRVALFPLDADARVSGLSAYLDGNGPGSGTQATRAVIYADRSGAPGALVATSAEVVISTGQAAGWVSYPLGSSIDLAAGDYWLGILASGPGQVGRFDYTAVPGTLLYNADSYSDGAAAGFGAPLTPSASRITIHAELEQAPQVTFGARQVQGDGWNNLSTDKKRATAYTLSSAGTLESLSAYLDGNGPGSGTQATRAVVYADQSGAPGALVATSAEVVIARGRSAGWVEYQVPGGPTLAPGTYWLGVISSGPGQVGRFDYRSIPGGLLYNADAYADGAASGFGAPLAPSESAMTINATVRPQAAAGLSVGWPGAAGATLSGLAFIDASVSGAGVAEVRYLVDGRPTWSDSAAPFTHLLDTTAIAAGSHTVSVEARDSAGAVLAREERSFIVADTLAPLLSLSGLGQDAVAAGTVSVEAAAGDVSGVDRVEFLLDGRQIASDTVAPFAASFDADLLAHGAHVLRAEATDGAGNVARLDRAFSVVDGDLPTLSIDAPADGSTVSGQVAIAARAADRSGIASVRVLIDGALAGTDSEAPFTHDLDADALSDGPHTVAVAARDGADNERTITRTWHLADRTAPALASHAPAAGSLDVETSAPITLTFSEPLARASVSATSVRLERADGAPIPSTPALSADGRTITLTSDALPGAAVVTVVATDALTDVAGNPLVGGRFSFTTAEAASVAPITFGAAAPAGDGWNNLSTDKKRVSRYALADTGDLVRLSAYLDGNGPDPGTQATRAVVYADEGGLPGALVGASEAVTITAGQAAGWVDYAMPPAVRLNPGDYWIGILAAGPAQVGRFDHATVAGSLLYNADAFSDGAAPRFGAPLTPSASRITMRAHLRAPDGDVTAPDLTIDSPAAGQSFPAGGSLTIAADARDASGIASVVFSIDGAELATDTSAPYSATWDLSGVAPGTHTISVRATDAASNVTTATRTVDVQAPAGGAMPGTRIFTGDWETGSLSQYAGAQVGQNTTGRVTAVTAPKVQGNYAGRFEVRAGDDFNGGGSNRSEVMLKVANEVEGDERWYEWSSMFASDYPNVTAGHQIFTQWHATAGGTQPMLVFYASGSTIGFKTVASSWSGSKFVSKPSVVHWSGPMNRGAWHDFRIHVKWSSNPATGYVELWRNGARVVPRTHLATLIAGQDAYLKQGMYRNADANYTSVVFTDGLVINKVG